MSNKPSKAFISYLKSISLNKAVNHVIDCLTNGEPNNEAWKLMAYCHGEDWATKPEDLPQKIIQALTIVLTKDTIEALDKKKITKPQYRIDCGRCEGHGMGNWQGTRCESCQGRGYYIVTKEEYDKYIEEQGEE